MRSIEIEFSADELESLGINNAEEGNSIIRSLLGFDADIQGENKNVNVWDEYEFEDE
jgi:hypothetical protein